MVYAKRVLQRQSTKYLLVIKKSGATSFDIISEQHDDYRNYLYQDIVSC